MTTPSPYACLAQDLRQASDQPSGAVRDCQAPWHDEQFELRDRYNGKPLKNCRYCIDTGVEVIEGVTDEQGLTARVSSGERATRLKVNQLPEKGRIESDGTGEHFSCV